MSPSLDADSVHNMAAVPRTTAPSGESLPILILSPSSLSRRPQILESLLSSLHQPHDLQMLDRIALNFAYLPPSHYAEAILALPNPEENVGEVDADYNELPPVLCKLLETMQPGGRIKLGNAGEKIVKDAILAGFLVENENQQVTLGFQASWGHFNQSNR